MCGLTVGFFSLAALLVAACDRIVGSGPRTPDRPIGPMGSKTP